MVHDYSDKSKLDKLIIRRQILIFLLIFPIVHNLWTNLVLDEHSLKSRIFPMAWANFPAMKDATDILRRSMERERLGHAYILSGVDLGALETFGLNLAKSLNCMEPPLGGHDCCDECVSCRKIDSGNHADVMMVRPESKLRQIRISQITRRNNSPPRVLHDLVYMTATESEWKVAILVGAERLNHDAANASFAVSGVGFNGNLP